MPPDVMGAEQPDQHSVDGTATERRQTLDAADGDVERIAGHERRVLGVLQSAG
jgi:hypothetical protein